MILLCLLPCLLAAGRSAVAQDGIVFDEPRFYPALYHPGVADSNGATIVQLAAGDSAGNLSFPMFEAGGVIEGRTVASAEGGSGPLAGVLIRVIRGNIRVLARSGADGAFRVTGVPPGEVIVRYATDDPLSQQPTALAVYHPGTQDSSLAQRIAITEAQVTALPDAALPPGASLEGAITEAAGGQPAPGLEVFALSGEGRRWVSRSASDGSFRIGGLGTGTYTLHVDPRDGLHAEEYLGGARRPEDAEWLQVVAGERRTGLALALDPGGEIRGVVRRAIDGTGLVGAAVEATSLASGRVYRSETYRYGFYVLPALPAGAYRVYVPELNLYYQNTSHIEQARAVQVIEDETTYGIDFSGTPVDNCQLPPPAFGTVFGNVDADFAGVDSAIVRVYNDSDTLEVPLEGTDHFAIGCIPPGLYKIAFIADGPLCAQYHPRREREDEAVPVEVVAGDTVLTWFTPKPAGSISGVLSDAGSGESIAGASLRAVELHTRLISRAISADDGSFSFRRVRVPGNHGLDSGLPPGRWRIQADTTVAPGPSSTPILAASIAATPEGSGSVRVCWSLPAGGPWFYQLVRRFADEAEPAPGVEVLLAGRAVYDSVEVHHDAPARGDGALAQYGLRFAASEEALAAEGGNAVGHVWVTWAEPVHLGGTAAGEPRQRLAARPVPWNGQGEVVISLLPVASTVDEGSLSIYDPGGRELNRLRWPAGARSVSWNGLDDQGRKISSRFVLLRLHGRKTASGSLALIR